MALIEEIRSLSDQALGRLDSAREFYVHTRQAWRLVQQLHRKGHPVGIVDLATKRALSTGDLESRAQRYVTIQLPESIFGDLSRCLEDWLLGFIRIWLTAFPEDLDLKFDHATGRRPGKKQDQEVQVPLSRLLFMADKSAVLAEVIEKVVRSLTYERPDKWFRYIDSRVDLGCPDETQRHELAEMKAARDCLAHNRGVINRDYLEKAGRAGRYAEGALVQIDEPYLLKCFDLLRGVIVAMTDATTRLAPSPKPPRPNRSHRRHR